MIAGVLIHHLVFVKHLTASTGSCMQGTRIVGLQLPYISELKQGTNRSLVSFTSLVISSDNVNRGLVLLLLLCLIYKPGHN